MHRRSHLLAAAVVVVGAAANACGDLVIPSNSANSDDSGALSSNTGGLDDDASADARPPANCDAGTHPVALACTGLYSDWTRLALAPDVQAYQPGATMWSDGADSSRWVWLPPGSKIDSTDLNNWPFPVGTMFWQEQRLLGKRVDTRFLWKMAPNVWFRTTYAWSENEGAAPELTTGLANARGLPYEIPAASACEKCHDGENDFVLGFELVGLALPQSSGLNLQALQTKLLLSNPPAALPTVPGDVATTGSLAFLHANCGTSCHNRNTDAGAEQTGLFLKLTVDPSGALPQAAQQTDTWITAYNVPSNFTPSGYDAGGFWRLRPADAAHSMIPWRASRRGTTQMPPLGTHLVDQNDVQLLQNWVNGLN